MASREAIILASIIAIAVPWLPLTVAPRSSHPIQPPSPPPPPPEVLSSSMSHRAFDSPSNKPTTRNCFGALQPLQRPIEARREREQVSKCAVSQVIPAHFAKVEKRSLIIDPHLDGQHDAKEGAL